MKQAIVGIKKKGTEKCGLINWSTRATTEARAFERCNFDLEMLEATGVCNGIENYSRYLTGRICSANHRPLLFEFIPDNAIVFADLNPTCPCPRLAACIRVTSAAK
jgi:excinuclease ABC subunit B